MHCDIDQAYGIDYKARNRLLLAVLGTRKYVYSSMYTELGRTNSVF